MLNKPMILVLFVLLSLVGLFGYLSYEFYGQKTKAQAELSVLKQSYSDLETTLRNKELSCQIDDKKTAEFLTEKEVVSQSGQKGVDVINSLPRKPVVVQPTPTTPILVNQNEASNKVVDLDGDLPPGLVEILNKSFCSAAGNHSVMCPAQTLP